MNDNQLYAAALEAVLFAVGEPIAADKLADALGIDIETVLSLLDELGAELKAMGLPRFRTAVHAHCQESCGRGRQIGSAGQAHQLCYHR